MPLPHPSNCFLLWPCRSACSNLCFNTVNWSRLCINVSRLTVSSLGKGISYFVPSALTLVPSTVSGTLLAFNNIPWMTEWLDKSVWIIQPVKQGAMWNFLLVSSVRKLYNFRSQFNLWNESFCLAQIESTAGDLKQARKKEILLKSLDL